MIETELMRIGISLPDTLLSKFDEIVEKRGYSSRSEGMRDAIKSYISHYEWVNNVKGYRIRNNCRYLWQHEKRPFKCFNKYSAQLFSPDKIFSACLPWSWKLFWTNFSQWKRWRYCITCWIHKSLERSQILETYNYIFK